MSIESFSVVVPCHNAAAYVEQALRSVAQQSIAPQEVIVVDDGSTDASVETVMGSGVDVHLIRTHGRNGARARNIGVNAARGHWIAFLDADDIWYANHLQSIRDLVEDSAAIAHLNTTDNIHPTTNEITSRSIIIPIHEASNDLRADDYFRACRGRCVFVGMSAFAIERQTFDGIGGLDETLLRRHDIDLWLRVMPDRRWAYSPVPSSAYRAGRAGNLSSARVSAKIFRLRALIKNRSLFESDLIDPMLEEAASAAVEMARAEGTAAEIREALALAAPHLRS